jgi:cytochrome P450
MTSTEKEQALSAGLQLTALDPDFREDPYPILKRLREDAPARRDPMLGRIWLTAEALVDEILRDRTTSVEAQNGKPDAMSQAIARRIQQDEGRKPSILRLDDPEHQRLRKLVNKAFTPRSVERMRPRTEEIAATLLDEIGDRETFDIINDFSGPLPTVVIAEMLGVDPAMRADFKRWSDTLVLGFLPFPTDEQLQQMQEASRNLDRIFQEEIAKRRVEHREDLIGGMVAAEEAGDQMDDEEIVTMCGLLLIAGNVTTTDLIGNGMHALLRHPEQLELLRREPERIENAVEEMLRYDGPVTNTGRIAMRDMEMAGCPIEKGDWITVSIAGANHDPDFIDRPDEFDITREDIEHHAFGGGAHYCLGAPLARMEAQVGVNALLRRFPHLELADEKPPRRGIPVFRGFERLLVRTRPGVEVEK